MLWRSRAALALALTGHLVVSLSGCSIDNLSRGWVKFWSEARPEQKNDAASTDPGPHSQPSLAPARAHAELLQEVYRDVFERDPTDRNAFGSLVNSLNQGASIEGIYNGIIHSAEYRELEEKSKGASPFAVKIFGEEMAILKSERIPEPQREKWEAFADRLSREQVGTSFYTLKRLLGEEAGNTVTGLALSQEALARWYSKWATRMVSRRVDFGLPPRNLAEEGFHFKWAFQNPSDRVLWEVLNRLHRVMNEANRK